MNMSDVLLDYDTTASTVMRAALRLGGGIIHGQEPSAEMLDSALFHLVSILKEHPVPFPSASILAWTLASRIAPEFDSIFPPAGIEPKWYGDDMEGETFASVIIAGVAGDQVSVEDAIWYLRFYTGEQWDPKVAQRRKSEGRPCLIINRLPGMVSRILAKATTTQQNDEKYRTRVAVEVTRRNRDAQIIYNWMVSNVAELLQSEAEKRRNIGGVQQA